jgi:hypothetical protein
MRQWPRPLTSRLPLAAKAAASTSVEAQKDVNQDQTSSGVHVQGQVVEQLLGGVAHEL